MPTASRATASAHSAGTTGPQVVRRRCKAGIAAGGAVYALVVATDAVRHTTADDSVVIGVEILAGLAVAVCTITLAMLWGIEWYTARTDAQRAEEAAFAYTLAGQVADTFPRPRAEPGTDRALR